MRKKSWDDSGVSEVIGTILILGMTVVLFSVVLIWVFTLPTPSPDVKADFQGELRPIYKTDGSWDGVNITLRHNSGERLLYTDSRIYINIYRGSQTFVDRLKNRGFMTYGPDNGRYYGLIDGNDYTWNTGERWQYTNHSIQQNDKVEVIIVDITKSILLWQRVLQGLSGLNPPIFVDKWADRDPSTPTLDAPRTGSTFYLFAKVVDPDNDLNKNSVYAIVTAFYGSKDYRENPQKMKDDGTGGDQAANDGVFTFTASWLIPQNMSWDGSVVVFNATDTQGHKTTSRMTLSVIQGPGGGGAKPGKPGSGAPGNLHYNGLQGFNIFNSTEWDYSGYDANETRTFKEKETVVVVVASALLMNSKGAHNEFYLYDPFSNVPPEPVVYGTTKVPGPDTQASNTLAFQFYEYVNGYNVFTYRFELNNESSVGKNYYYPTPPSHPPYYWCAKYPLEITLWDDIYPMPNKFHTTDTINITDNNGNMRTYPKLETFANPGFTIPSNTFNNTDVVYVRITMATVDNSYYVGVVTIQDYIGGTQVWKAPIDGRKVNQPICPVTAQCTSGAVAVEMHSGSVSYRFALNLSLASQDPWVPGLQNYALRVLSVRDVNEEYTLALQRQLTIWSSEYRLDIALTNWDVANQAWGTHDLAYWIENLNGWDKWGPPPVPGLFTAPGPPNAWSNGQAVKYLDYDMDGDLDIVASFKQSNQDSWLYVFRRDLDTSGNTIWTPFRIDGTSGNTIMALATGSVDKDTAPEIIAGDGTGKVWYYKNDGSWTKTAIDYSRPGAVNMIDLGDFDGDRDLDVAVARSGGKVTWYPNIDGNGKFTTTPQTDWWKATEESTSIGAIETGDYTYTYADDAQKEKLRERTNSFPTTYSNNTAWAEATFTTGSIYSGSFQDTWSKNTVYEALSETTCAGNKQCLEAVWPIYMPSGSTQKLKVNGYRSNNDAGDTFAFYYSTNSNGPWTGPVFSLSNTSQNDYYWPATISLPGFSGIVYIRVLDNFPGNNEPADKLYIDHMYIETYIPAKTTSALEHYWKLQTLPNRPSSSYTLYVKGYRQNNGTNENDFFLLFYSTSGKNGFYYGPVINVSATTEPGAPQSYTLPSGVAGASVWIKVIDSDRTANRNQWDGLYVNLLNITVVTTGGVTGIDINIPDGNNVMALDAGNQNAGSTDWFDDLAVGTSGGNIYKIMGGPAGLIPPSLAFASPGGSILGIKLAECYANRPGLEIVASTGASIYIYRADGATGTLITTFTTPGSEAVLSMAAGDVDGDQDDDVVVGTGPGHVFYFRNNAGVWVSPTPNPPAFDIGEDILGIALGDVSNSKHMGR